MKDFVIYFSGHGEIKDQTLVSLEELRKHCQYRYDVRIVSGDALIGRSRSRAATEFLKADDTPYMIFIDTDIVFKPEDVELIYEALERGFADVVAGSYAVANGEHLAISGTIPLTFDGRVAEIEYVSTGFMGITRKILEKLKEDMPLLHEGSWCECYPFFESGRYEKSLWYISEDWDFCEKVRGKGGHVFLHTGVLVGHVKTHVLDPHDALKNMSMTVEKTRNEATYQELLKDVADYYKLSSEEAQKRIREGCTDAIKEAGEVEDYYHDGETYPFDLTLFNTHRHYEEQRLGPLQDIRDSKFLDFGCGIGTAAFYLAQRRNEVIAYDINKANLAFARFRNERFGYSRITFTDTLPDEIDVDYVTAIDVFEHIKDIEGEIANLGKRLKKGTKLYFVSPWDHKHPLHITGWDAVHKALHDGGFLVWNENWAVKE